MMEEELKCPLCKHFFSNPVLLPCAHSLCLNCALHGQQLASAQQPSEETDCDQLSLTSEADSGVVCSSRPNSLVGPTSPLLPPSQGALSLACPLCSKMVYFDESGAHNLPRNRALQNIVDKYGESRNLPILCQLCEEDPKEASVMCLQCEVFYCVACRDSCHPSRGPLATHTLIGAREGKSRSQRPRARCNEHNEESLSFYCLLCRIPVCGTCVREGRHLSHDVQQLTAICKAQKTELSQNLQILSEKAKGTTEFIQRLKSMTDKTADNCALVEKSIEAECSALVELIQVRCQQLVEFVREERDHKIKSLKDQAAGCTGRLQRATGLLQFCIEALKETDPATFMQVGASLIHRVSNLDLTWSEDLPSTPWVREDFDLTLDRQSVITAIEQMTFLQMKPPGAPLIIPEECTVENNSITVAWQPNVSSFVEGYILELDDGSSGAFREVYCGKETICTVDGLHFNSLYNARLKAFNSTGEGPYSEPLALHTAEVAFFSLDPSSSHPEVALNEEWCGCESFEHRVALATLGFSRGRHYWEATILRYDNHSDAAFGVARCDVAKDAMLGKDEKGWSMYIDNQRSWFLHNDTHTSRTEGGIRTGVVVGILLDLDSHSVSFSVGGRAQGPPMPLGGAGGVYYPAFSLNRNVRIALQTALEPPKA